MVSTAKPTIGIALGGGAARGWAHIGVLKTLVEAGLEPERIEAARARATKWMFVARASMPHSTTRSLSEASSGSGATVSPITAFQPASFAGEQMVRSRRDAPIAWKNGCPALRCTSPIVPA